jgi:hypothetical protein
MASSGERARQGGDRAKSHRATLPDLGLNKHDSSRFQQIAGVPEMRFEEVLAQARAAQEPITSASVRRLLKQPDFTPGQRLDHERLWRVFRAIENIADQDVSPQEWLDNLPEYMQQRFATHMAFAGPWLEQFLAKDIWNFAVPCCGYRRSASLIMRRSCLTG